MRARLTRIFAILFVLLLYTGVKAAQLWPQHPGLAWAAVPPLFALMIGWQFIYRNKYEVFESGWFVALAWLSSGLISLWSTFVLFSLAFDLVKGVMWMGVSFAARLGAGPALDPSALSVMRWLPLALSLLITGFGFLAVWRGPRLKEVTVRIPDLHPALHGLTLAQISDLHVGPTVRRTYVEKVVRRTNAACPDLVLLTGDITDAKASSIRRHAQPLADLQARWGRFYVTGNHEYYWDAPASIELIHGLGFVPLLNQNHTLEINGARALIAGVTDPAGEHLNQHRPDLEQAARSEQRHHLKILLSHRPDFYAQAAELGFDLQLSGHTHSGQFFPFSLLVPLFHKYYRGLYRHNRMWLYVNPGTGYWGPANRFAVAAEITLLRLVAG